MFSNPIMIHLFGAAPIIRLVGFHEALRLMIHSGNACWFEAHAPAGLRWACTAVHP